MGFQPDHTSFRCLPKCEEDEYYDFYQTKQCVSCQSSIPNCNRCAFTDDPDFDYPEWILAEQMIHLECSECAGEEYNPSALKD